MTLEEVRLKSEIKRYNERARALKNTFGEQSPQYQKMVNEMNKIGELKLTKSGTYALKNDLKSIRQYINNNQINEIHKLNNVETVGQVLKQAKKEYVKQEKKKPTRKELIEFVNLTSNIHEFLMDNLEKIYEVNAFKNMLKRKENLSIDELSQIQEYIKNGTVELETLFEEFEDYDFPFD